MGPEGFAELGRLIIGAQPLRGAAAGARSTACGSSFPTGFFKEFVVDFDGTGRTVAEINRGAARTAASSAARTSRADFPELGQSALYCVTEVHTQADIDRLADARRRRSSR